MAKKNTPAAPEIKIEKPSGMPTEQVLVYVFLSFALLFSIFIRFRLAALPLERDEGEYAFFGQNILNGIPPFAEAGNMKLPGVYYFYALIMAIFGQTATGIHLGLLIVNLISIFLIFLIGKKLISPAAGAVSAACFSIFCLVPQSYGLAAHATHFVALFALTGLLSMLYHFENRKIIWLILSGLSFGLSVLMKQHALFFILFGLVILVLENRKSGLDGKLKSITIYSLAAILPYLFIVLIAILNGTFDKFWHWTMNYASQYVGIKSLSEGWKNFTFNLGFITVGVKVLWLFSIAGLIFLWKTNLDSIARKILLSFFIFSFLTVCPGWYFRNHYFISLFPAVALLVGVFYHFLNERISKLDKPILKFAPAIGIGLLLIFSLLTHTDVLFTKTSDQVCTQIYGRNPFREAVEIAKFIKENTAENDRIVVFGSEPEIYFYSNRKPATSFIYTYPLMENQTYSKEMQDLMRAEIEIAKPRFIIFVNNQFSWLFTAQSDIAIINWFDYYSSQNYTPVGMADMISPGNTKYVWRNAMAFYKPQNPDNLITVLERKFK